MTKIYLGTSKDKERIHLSKHSWDCGWYWGFGYLGNNNIHYHFESYLDGNHWNIENVFDKTLLTQKNWWVIFDLFKQAYALKATAAVYQHGGYISASKNVTDVIQNYGYADLINHDLGILLNTIWDYITNELTNNSNSTNNSG